MFGYCNESVMFCFYILVALTSPVQHYHVLYIPVLCFVEVYQHILKIIFIYMKQKMIFSSLYRRTACLSEVKYIINT